MSPALSIPNGPQGQIPPLGLPAEEFNVLALLDVVLACRWLIAGVAVTVTFLAAGYALLAAPTYQADTLVQVEDPKGDGTGILGDAANLFEIRSPAAAEMQILRSRLVVGQAVVNLQLDRQVTPRYLPLIGRWLASRATAPSDPELPGLSGYVSGNESLDVTEFEIPPVLEGRPFRVRLAPAGYALLSPDGEVLANGTFGQTLFFNDRGNSGHVLVTNAIGRPGAEFYVTRFSRLATTQELQKNLTIVEEGKQSGVIRASLEGGDPHRIARTLNEIGTLYVRQNVERKAAEAEKALRFLDTTFLPQLRQQVEESEDKFNEFRNRNSTFDLTDEAKLMLERSVTLQTSLLDLQQKRKEARALFTPEHHSIQTIDAQIAAINAELAALDSRVKHLPNLEQELLRLMRDVKVNNELLVSLLNSSQELRLVKEGTVGNVRIVDVAAVTRKWPRREMVIGLAAVIGLLIGVILAFVRDLFDRGLKDPAEIEQRVGLHVFATVPHSELQVKNGRNLANQVPGTHLLAVSAPRDPAVEGLRSLRTALQFAMLDTANRVVLISGPTPGIGKSFTSVNLAAVIGAADKKVLLIDADLRKGHLHQYFGLAREGGLSEVISGSVKLRDAVRRAVAPHVDLLTTGLLPPNPAELLMTPLVPAVLQAVGKHYDIVLVDTSPVLVASDTATIATLAGAVFLVARAEVTTMDELRESTKRMLDTGVKVKGVIFNDLNPTLRRYGYGGSYRYAQYNY
jgi:tyrosine-protein kinase Etk/Wzc